MDPLDLLVMQSMMQQMPGIAGMVDPNAQMPSVPPPPQAIDTPLTQYPSVGGDSPYLGLGGAPVGPAAPAVGSGVDAAAGAGGGMFDSRLFPDRVPDAGSRMPMEMTQLLNLAYNTPFADPGGMVAWRAAPRNGPTMLVPTDQALPQGLVEQLLMLEEQWLGNRGGDSEGYGG